ncbi:30S ribosomal protein S13 [Candidatus Marinamargulisbacteria bacterium SCGC AG-439-L15]|nr:30S ribosomal protein S13 [Candidatus Marinamargulisbacteria bacterium SCGC AG-439-L15]
MARIVGVDLPKHKRIDVALTYIFGVGRTIAIKILEKVKISPATRVKELSETEIIALRDEIRELVTEGDLRRRINQDVKRLMDIGCYRGIRHKKKLPVRGQRTHTNARTKRGKRIAVAGKKKVTK